VCQGVGYAASSSVILRWQERLREGLHAAKGDDLQQENILFGENKNAQKVGAFKNMA